MCEYDIVWGCLDGEFEKFFVVGVVVEFEVFDVGFDFGFYVGGFEEEFFVGFGCEEFVVGGFGIVVVDEVDGVVCMVDEVGGECVRGGVFD